MGDVEELWTSRQCAEHCGIEVAVWQTYVYVSKVAPAPVVKLSPRRVCWDAGEVRAWQASRPGKGWRRGVAGGWGDR